MASVQIQIRWVGDCYNNQKVTDYKGICCAEHRRIGEQAPSTLLLTNNLITQFTPLPTNKIA